MDHLRWIAIAGVITLAAGVVEAEESTTDHGLDHETVDYLLADGASPERWRALDNAEPTVKLASWSQRMRGVDFEDRSAYARVSKIRSLSLLTLGQFGQKRLFLGVNQEGLLGLHFNAFPHLGDDRYLELARMPYLDEPQDDDEF